MLAKLLKYEWRAVSKLMLPFTIAVLGVSLLGTMMLRLNLYLGTLYERSAVLNIFSSLTTVFTVLVVLAIIGYGIATIILLLQRYYKNFFSDEGYLTFTLPVKTSSLLWSKLIVALAWIAISVVVATAGIMIIVLFGTAANGLINQDAWIMLENLLHNLAQALQDAQAVIYFVEMLLMCLASVVGTVIIFYLAITIGSIIAKKHKILVSVLMYYAINMAISLALTALYAVMMTMLWSTGVGIGENAVIHIVFLGGVAIYAVAAVAGFLVNNRLLRRKLSLA